MEISYQCLSDSMDRSFARDAQKAHALPKHRCLRIDVDHSPHECMYTFSSPRKHVFSTVVVFYRTVRSCSKDIRRRSGPFAPPQGLGRCECCRSRFLFHRTRKKAGDAVSSSTSSLVSTLTATAVDAVVSARTEAVSAFGRSLLLCRSFLSSSDARLCSTALVVEVSSRIRA